MSLERSNCFYTSIKLLVFAFLLVAINNHIAFAQSAVQLGPRFEFSDPAPQVFFVNKMQVSYSGGPVILSSSAKGMDGISSDDQVTITVTRPDGSVREFDFIFGRPNNLGLPITIGPQDVTFLFQNGVNTVSIVYRNNFGGAFSTAYFLVGNVTVPLNDCERDLGLALAEIDRLEQALASAQNNANAANGAVDAAVRRVESDLQQVFNDPRFTIPGNSPLEKLQNLINAVVQLEKGRKQGIYQNLTNK